MNIEKDIQAIIDYSHRFAEHMLNDEKEFYPFGAKIGNDGKLVAVGYNNTETDFPESQTVIEALKEEFEKDFVNGKLRAYGLTYDVRVQIDEQGDKSDSICIDITHQESNDIPRYYFTYSWNDNDDLIFGESFGIKK
ncbi:hypothetical protein [Mangrovibacterium diazotrophicum]|uniref:Uncharacterized protein n=1 Tax=Mangrovibacterium diazotrophicum TaxID=1261403 RepID=A0A419VW84_9BACT|nr:hypothetical protein [Mangrovibacterium diazotrophicum]RKD86405.1 hypothetical protein BC643_4096 [Mangrovibacterium diazotrophicum]